MIATRLLNIFKSFSPDEIKSFEKFLLSPFFNNSKIYTKFYKELMKFYPEFKSDLLTPENIFSRLYEGKPFNKQTMWNLSSGLEKLVEEYLIHSALVNRPYDRFNLIFEELAQRKLDRQFKKKLHEMKKIMGEAKIDEEYFKNLGILENALMLYWQVIRDLHDKDLENAFNFFMFISIDYFVQISRTKDILDVNKENFNDKQLCDTADEFLRSIDFKAVINISEKNDYKYADIMKFYCNVILCSLHRESEKYYFEVKKFLFNNHILFEFNEKKNLTTFIANYCIYNIQLGNSVYIKELFEINKFRLEHGLAVYKNGKINKTLYMQIVQNATSLNKIKWVSVFIERYTPLLFEEHQERMKKLARAYVFFSQKKYDEVFDCLKKFKFADVVEKTSVKNLIAKTYFEMNEFELLLYHIDSTKHFLKNNKKLGVFRSEVNGKFFGYLKSIVTAIEKRESGKLKKLEQKIKAENAVNNKVWLLEKISEVKYDR